MASDQEPRHYPSPSELKALIDAERRGTPFLSYRAADGEQVLFELRGKRAPVTIGRATDAPVCLTWDDQVSRFHAELHAVGSDWAVVDDGLSMNGTYVNGRRISGRRRLIDRDTLVIGRTRLTFHHPSQMPLERTARPGRFPAVEELTPTQRRVLVALCRPYEPEGGGGAPATNREIADEVHLSVDAVKTHLRSLFHRFDVDELVQNQKRAKLAEIALQWGIVARSDFD